MPYDHRRYRANIKKDARSHRKERTKGRGRYSYFKLPKTTTTVRLVPGEYEAFDGSVRGYFVKFTHFDVRDKRVRDCQGDRCLACWDRDQGGNRKERFTRPSQKAAYTLIHLADYHLVNETNRDTGKEYTTKAECEGRRCKYCKDGVEKVFGKKMHWTITEDDQAILEAHDRELYGHCQCGEGEIYTLAYECPKCMHQMLDAQASELSEDAIVEYGDDEQRCPACGHVDLPAPIIECVKQDDNGEWVQCCDDPRPMNIFSVNLEVKGVEKTRNDKTFLTLQIVGDNDDPIPEEVLEKLGEPYDFDAMFDMDLKKQSELLGIPIPKEWEGGKKAPAAVDYD